MNGWVGVDLDGTLAHYSKWVSIHHIGKPIPAMVERVKMWLQLGLEVRIFTARVADPATRPEVVSVIEKWCFKHLGKILPVTNEKDFGMIELWDDRCVQIETNTGMILGSPSDLASRSTP